MLEAVKKAAENKTTVDTEKQILERILKPFRREHKGCLSTAFTASNTILGNVPELFSLLMGPRSYGGVWEKTNDDEDDMITAEDVEKLYRQADALIKAYRNAAEKILAETNV